MYGADDPVDFGIELILQEESAPVVEQVPQNRPQPPVREKKNVGTVTAINLKDFTESGRFPIEDASIGVEMPLSGPGELESLIIKANSNNFHFVLRLDDKYIIDEDWTEIETNTLEMNRIGAYTTSGESILTASDYPFESEIYMAIRPYESITFSLVRAEFNLY